MTLRLSLFLVILIGTLFGLSTPARADTIAGTENGLTYVSDVAPITPNQPAAATADCPQGQKVVGGGGDALSTELEGILASANPQDGSDGDSRPDDGFTAYAFNTTTNSGNTIAWAICAPGKVEYVARSLSVNVNRARVVRAKCPDGTRVVGGGIYMTGSNSEIFVSATRPWDSPDEDERPDDGWLVRAANISGSQKVLTAHAMCREDWQIDPFGALSDLFASGGANVFCDSDQFSLAGLGGVIQGEPTLVRLSAIFPVDNSQEAGIAPDDLAVISGENLTGSSVKAGPFGICRR